MRDKRVAVIGGGPAGLMAAERLAEQGLGVDLFEAMPTVGRKFMLAGKSGLNITHSETYDRFVTRYGSASAALRASLDGFTPENLRAWAEMLGSETFVGSSGRVFPVHMKASPLLRNWLKRLDNQGVAIHVRHRWTGFGADGSLTFETPTGERTVYPSGTLLTLGGASWPRLGSDAAWVRILTEKGIVIKSLEAANNGFNVAWSETFRDRFAGSPVKSVVASADELSLPGEFVVTRDGVEGSLVYAVSKTLRDQLTHGNGAIFRLDLAPGRTVERLASDIERQNPKQSFSNRLRKAAGIDGVKAGLVRECLDEATRGDARRLAAALKSLPIKVDSPRPIAEAISTAGGIAFDELTPELMVKRRPGLFVAGEMLDWEAPTGGYLLTACFATGRAAADGMARWLKAGGASLDAAKSG